MLIRCANYEISWHMFASLLIDTLKTLRIITNGVFIYFFGPWLSLWTSQKYRIAQRKNIRCCFLDQMYFIGVNTGIILCSTRWYEYTMRTALIKLFTMINIVATYILPSQCWYVHALTLFFAGLLRFFVSFVVLWVWIVSFILSLVLLKLGLVKNALLF